MQIPKANWKDERGVETSYVHARRGYYGGRTQCFRPQAANGFRYDINSAYPAALVCLYLPIGPYSETSDSRAIGNLWSADTTGIYTVNINVPEMHIPPLPVRGKGRIYYPTGRVTGTWTSNELSYALTLGCNIVSFLHAMTWKESSPVMRDYCQRIWNLRDSVGPKTPLGKWLKLLANNIYGKFAQHPEVENAYVVTQSDSIALCPAAAQCMGIYCARDIGCCKHWCWRTCGRELPLDSGQLVRIQEAWRMGDNAHIHWAAFLTAHTRITLHRQLVDDGTGGRTAVYCDTDSVYATVERRNWIGDKLGEFKYEGPFFEFQCLAPKAYSYIDGETGEFVARCKGIADPISSWDILTAGKSVQMNRGVYTFKSGAMKGNLFLRKQLERRIRADGIHFGDRVLRDDGLTYPMDMRNVVINDRVNHATSRAFR